MKLLSPSVLFLWVIHLSHSFHIKKLGENAYRNSYRNSIIMMNTISADDAMGEAVTAKSVTNEIMSYFKQTIDLKTENSFKKRLTSETVQSQIDGLHVITLLFQSARTKRYAKSVLPVSFMLTKLKKWDKVWSERDMSTFVYGIRALECFDKTDGELIRFGAKKISESPQTLSSRAIGNALYGLRCITSDSDGIPDLCSALAIKINQFRGDLNGQDIGIGLYGLQGMSADVPEVRELVYAFAQKISSSEAELDAQALSNALYGLQARR